MGFKFKNIDSDEYGLVVQTVNEPMTAAVKTNEYNPKFRSGTLDYSDMNGQLYYEDKLIEYKATFKAADLDEFNRKIAELGRWLTGKGVLVTLRGETYSNARLYGGIDIAPQFYGTFGEFNIQFRVGPFADA